MDDLDLVNASIEQLARIPPDDPDYQQGDPLPLCGKYPSTRCGLCPARAVTGTYCQPSIGGWSLDDELTFFCFLRAILEDLNEGSPESEPDQEL